MRLLFFRVMLVLLVVVMCNVVGVVSLMVVDVLVMCRLVCDCISIWLFWVCMISLFRLLIMLRLLLVGVFIVVVSVLSVWLLCRCVLFCMMFLDVRLLVRVRILLIV